MIDELVGGAELLLAALADVNQNLFDYRFLSDLMELEYRIKQRDDSGSEKSLSLPPPRKTRTAQVARGASSPLPFSSVLPPLDGVRWRGCRCGGVSSSVSVCVMSCRVVLGCV